MENSTGICGPNLTAIGAANSWPSAGLPRGPAAVLGALHIRDPRPAALDTLTDSDWRRAAEFADPALLTLPLARVARRHLPAWLRDRIAEDAANNRRRLQITEELYRALDERLRAAGVEYLALKGLAQCPQFGTPAEWRVQYDIDLFVPRESMHRAAGQVAGLGLEPLQELDRLPTDHLPPFIRKNGWEWRGDYFDPELPLAVELHFQFWNQPVERIRVPDVELFWERRVTRRIAGIDVPVLCAADGLGYTALHLLRHLLRGSARPFHIFEMAGFLEGHATDDSFWRSWRALHSPEFRRLQAVIFRLATEWFGCDLGPVAEREVADLPAPTKAWFEQFALSPARAIFHPHKDELWLHLSLLDSWRDKCAAARLRLLPLTAPGPVDALHTPVSELTLRRRVRRAWRYAAYVCPRGWRHLAALPHAAISGLRWWRYSRPNSDNLGVPASRR